jgi:hypothetical protein
MPTAVPQPTTTEFQTYRILIVFRHHLNRKTTGRRYADFSHFYHGMPTTR